MTETVLTRRSVLQASALALFVLSDCSEAQNPAPRSSTTVLRLQDFGGRPEAGFDNADAFRRAFAMAAAAGATEVRVGPGRYEIASLNLRRNRAIQRPSGVALVGEGRERTSLAITGKHSINYLFDASDATDVVTRGMTILGHGVKNEDAPYSNGLMRAHLSADAKGEMRNIIFEECDIVNFGSAAWFFLLNRTKHHAITGCGSRRCNWISRPNTSPAASSITVPGHFIYYSGFSGEIKNVIVDDYLMDASHIKGGFALIGDVNGGVARIGSLLNSGTANGHLGGRNGPGAYAVLFYRTRAGAPRRVSLTIGRLENCYSVGIYSAGAHDLDISVNQADGQRDTRDETLPKGILVLSGNRNVTARLGSIKDCNRVLSISLDGGNDGGAAVADAGIRVHLERIESRAGATDVIIGLGGSEWAGGVEISGRRSGPAAVGVDIRATSRLGLQDIDLSHFISSGARTPILIRNRSDAKLRRIKLPA